MSRPAHRLAVGLLGAVTAGCEAQTGSAPISGDVLEAKGWRAEVVVGGLSHPLSIAWLPDGSALVTERDGRLRRVRDGKLYPTPIAGLPPVLATGQGGLLDVSLHPDFADNGLVYLRFATGSFDAIRTVLARGLRVLRSRICALWMPDCKTPSFWESASVSPGRQGPIVSRTACCAPPR
jgi:glucose/arabinose dehydrogenase